MTCSPESPRFELNAGSERRPHGDSATAHPAIVPRPRVEQFLERAPVPCAARHRRLQQGMSGRCGRHIAIRAARGREIDNIARLRGYPTNTPRETSTLDLAKRRYRGGA